MIESLPPFGNSITYTAGAGASVTIDLTVTDANLCISSSQSVVTIDAPDCTISAVDAVCFLSTGNLATVLDAGVGATYVWTVTGGALDSQISNSITHSAGAGTSVTLDVTVIDANGCISSCQKIITIIQPSIEVTLELQAVTNVVTRDVTFTITDCGGSNDVRVLPVTTFAIGVGSVTIPGTSPNAKWISTREGRTLSRLAAVSYSICSVAVVNLTGADRLLAGDLHTVVVPQDDLVDVTDFTILAAEWFVPMDPNLSEGGDVTGDGTRNSLDFEAMQANFFAWAILRTTARWRPE